MSAEIHQFPVSRRIENKRVSDQFKKRKELVEWLRTVALWIEKDEVVCEPTALVLVLSGKTGDEVVWKGYQDNAEVSLKDAGRAAHAQFHTPYKRRGGNFHDRRKP